MPSNDTALTATDLSPIPTTITQDVSFSSAPLHPVWFKYTPLVGEYCLGLLAYAESGSTYRPKITQYLGPASAPTQLAGAPEPGHDQPGQFPLTPGVLTLFRVQDDGGGTIFTTPLVLSVLPAPAAAFPAGTVLITDDQEPLPGAFLNRTTGVLLGFRPFTNGEDGAMLPTGEFALTSDDSAIDNRRIFVYDKLGNQTSSTSTGIIGTSANMTNDATTFYFSNNVSTNILVKTISVLGVVGATTWTIPGHPYSMAVNRAGTILYHLNGSTSPGKIKRWDLALDVAMADLATLPASTDAGRDAFVLADGTLLITLELSSPARTFTVSKYNITTGAVVWSSILTYAVGLSDGPRLAIGHDDTYVLAWASKNVAGVRTSRFTILNLTTGAVVTDTDDIPVFEAGYGNAGAGQDTDMPRFGNSKSCPSLILRAGVAPGTTQTYTIRRQRRFLAPSSPDNKTMQMPVLELLLRTGIGLTPTDSWGGSLPLGVDPHVMIRVSRDGGKTWGPERWVSAGRLGKFADRVRLTRFSGNYRNMVIEVTVDAPVDWGFLAALAPNGIQEGNS